MIKELFGLTMTLAAGAAMAYETPTMGWSSWNTYHVNISDELIKSQADAMVKTGLKDLGYSHINIDDGWFGGRDKNGKHTFHAKRFPKGLKPVVDYIHSLGLKAGAYSDAGENTCGSIWDNDVLGQGVGFYGHDDEDAAFFFKENGFDFIKIDFCGGVGGEMGPHKRPGNSGKTNMSERVRYTAIRKAIDRVGRPEVRINLCRWAYPGTWAGEAGSSWRTTADIQPYWWSVKGIILENLFLGAYAGRGHYNDLDMLEVGRGMSVEEDRTHFAMWCMFASPLLIGCDLTKIAPEPLKLLKNRELVALDQDPLGECPKLVKIEGEVVTLARDLGTLGGTERAVAVCNLGDTKAKFRVSLAEVDLVGASALKELVDDVAMKASEALEGELDPHATRIFRVKAKKRLERGFYPSAWAWMEKYQEIDSSTRSPNYVRCNDCGSVTISGIGGAGGAVEWRDVMSAEGGDYTLEFVTAPPGLPYGFDVFVNGEKVTKTDSFNGWKCDVKLAKGFSTIRIYNDHDEIIPLKGFKLIRK